MRRVIPILYVQRRCSPVQDNLTQHMLLQFCAVLQMSFSNGGLFMFGIFFAAGFGIIFGFLVLCFPAFLLFCFSVFLLFAFPASLLFCFCALPASFLFCFYAFPASLLFCLCASVPFYFYYSTFSFLQSCVFAALLPAPLLLCFLSLLPLVFFSLLLLYSLLFVNTLGKTQRNLKEILTRNPKWTLKKP